MSQSISAVRLRERGFSLVELMVVVVLIAIIGGIAAPSFVQLTRRSQLSAAGNELVGAMQTARMTAVSRRETVSLCPTTTGNTCATSLGARWIVLTTAGEVIRDITMPANVAVKGSPNMTSANFRMTYGPSGFSRAGTGAAAPTTGTFSVCASNVTGENALDITSSMGRVSTRRRAASAACSNPSEL